MRREDYERQPSPKPTATGGEKRFVGVEITAITLACRSQGEPPDSFVVQIEIPGGKLLYGMQIDNKEDADVLIGSLIAARNKLWPQP